MAQHAILRFEKHKGHPAGPLEAHHERKKEQYASNPDIDTSRSKYNFHIVKPDGRYYHFIQSRIEQARCRTRKDSTRFVDTLITASPEFFKGKSPKEIAAYFQRAADFLIDRVGRENIVSAMVHMDEKTPHLHLVFVPLTKDNRLCAKEIIGNRANLTKWQDDFHACMVEQYPDLERGESASKTGRKHKYGEVDFRDLMEFTDEVLRRYPEIDADRMGVAGGSYGGFMTNWVIGHTDRFRCAVSQRSIANYVGDYLLSDIGYYYVPDQQLGTIWEHPERLWKASPLTYADRVKTPTLFIHADKDYRCTLANGLEMFAALKLHGVESKLCMFYGENHGLSREGKPSNRISRLSEILRWMDEHLKEE